MNRGWFMFFITLFNLLYWFSGAPIGGLLGNLLSIKVEGIEFIMVAIFIVTFMESFEKETQNSSTLIGLSISSFCLILFGKDYFILPSMGLIILLFTLLRKKLEDTV